MNSRTSCPRCEGYGFVHDSIEKHDKNDAKVRCKKCSPCRGVVVDKLPCRPCKSRGFLHPPSVHLKEHSAPDHMRCPDCIECRDCVGLGALDRKPPKQKQKQQQQPQQPTAPLPPTSSQYPQPLIPGIMPWNGGQKQHAVVAPPAVASNLFAPVVWGQQQQQQGGYVQASLGGERKGRAGSVSSRGSEGSMDGTIYTEDYLRAAPCPRCDGRGWKHDTSSKHDKIPTVRCKNCAACKACHSSGQVHGKIACPSCETKGFVHASKERDHDAPEKLRCFFCKTCPQCVGLGIVDNPAVAEQERLKAKIRAREEARAAKKKAKELAEAMAAATADATGGAPPLVTEQQQQQLLMMAVGMMLQQQQRAATTGVALPQPSLQMLMTAAAAASGVVPPIPMPPVLPVWMMPHPHAAAHGELGKTLHVAGIPGVGYVPAEQLLRMQVPMLPGGVAPVPPAFAAAQANALAMAQRNGPMHGMMGGPPQQVSQPLVQRDAVLRDVWG
ncbi:hypothetical protein HDU67_006895 [Dinochytrium kinnereticum]|nr:hypothetical protein HDU67_006895 [Dinochytrium kinnereticum]